MSALIWVAVGAVLSLIAVAIGVAFAGWAVTETLKERRRGTLEFADAALMVVLFLLGAALALVGVGALLTVFGL